MMQFPPNLFDDTPLSQTMRNNPCTAIDVGSAGGIIEDLNPISFAVDAIGFEPNPQHFDELSIADHHWRSLSYLPVAIGGQGGTRILYRPEFGNSSTIMRPITHVGDTFNKRQFFAIEKLTNVDVVPLSNALADVGVDNPDYLKLDVEGAEFEILEGSLDVLHKLSAIRVEVSFIGLREGQRLGMEVGHFLEGLGFRLMHMPEFNPWRIRGYQVHPSVSREPLSYSRGQLVHGDFLFMRDPSFFADPEQRMRGAFLAMAYGYFDHAERLLSEPATNEMLGLAPESMSLTKALDMASRRMARHLWRARVFDLPSQIYRLARDARNLMHSP